MTDGGFNQRRTFTQRAPSFHIPFDILDISSQTSRGASNSSSLLYFTHNISTALPKLSIVRGLYSTVKDVFFLPHVAYLENLHLAGLSTSSYYIVGSVLVAARTVDVVPFVRVRNKPQREILGHSGKQEKNVRSTKNDDRE